MINEINFLGLEFEGGQEKAGLNRSHVFAKQYFSFVNSLGVKINDKGKITANPKKSNISNSLQFQSFDWIDYENAFLEIERLLHENTPLVNWGGDHSVGISTAGAFVNTFPDGYVVWIDAHADLNLPNFSPTGNLHGMPVSILLNLQNIKSQTIGFMQETLKPQNLIYVGVRDLDPFEKQMIEELNIRLYSVTDIRNREMSSIATEILEMTKGKPLHISFDIDSVCPTIAPATGVPVPNGLVVDDLQTLALILSQHPDIRSVDIVEINPELGSRVEVERTYQIALSFLILILSLGGSYASHDRPINTPDSTSLEQSSQI